MQKKVFRTIETHTLGQPTRNIVGGFPCVPGKTMAEKFIYMKENEDWFRRLLSYEPRGNDYMSCTLITEPCTPGTDVGVLYFETSGWLPMCGHDTIGVSVALIETGMVKVTEPVTVIRLDTAAGVITVEAKVERGAVQEVSFTNAPAFVLREDLTVETEDFGALTMDVSWAAIFTPSCRQHPSAFRSAPKTAQSWWKPPSPSPETSTRRLTSAIPICSL